MLIAGTVSAKLLINVPIIHPRSHCSQDVFSYILYTLGKKQKQKYLFYKQVK